MRLSRKRHTSFPDDNNNIQTITKCPYDDGLLNIYAKNYTSGNKQNKKYSEFNENKITS